MHVHYLVCSTQRLLKSLRALLHVSVACQVSKKVHCMHFEKNAGRIDLGPIVTHVSLTQSLAEGFFKYALGIEQLKNLIELLEFTNNHVTVVEYSDVAQSS